MSTDKAKRQKAWTTEEAQRHIEAHASSGQSMAAYGRTKGIDAGRLWWWRRKLRQEQLQAADKVFVPLVVSRAAETKTPGNDRCIEVRLSGSRTLEVRPGFDPTTLQQLVMTLEKIPC